MSFSILNGNDRASKNGNQCRVQETTRIAPYVQNQRRQLKLLSTPTFIHNHDVLQYVDFLGFYGLCEWYVSEVFKKSLKQIKRSLNQPLLCSLLIGINITIFFIHHAAIHSFIEIIFFLRSCFGKSSNYRVICLMQIYVDATAVCLFK